MKISMNGYEKILQNIQFISCLQDGDFRTVEQIIKEKKYRKNEVILWEEETKNFMYIVFSGKVKVMQTCLEGKEQILAIHKRGDFFGEMSLLDGKTQPATVVALEDTTVGLITKTDFDRYLFKNDHALKQMIYLLCKRLRESWLMLRVLSFTDAESRVRAVLTHIGTLYGIDDMRGTIIPMKLTHKEIADFAALSRETVSRVLARFSRGGEIEMLDNKNIVIKQTLIMRASENVKLANDREMKSLRCN
jgi:CRP/FNR family transcriptional regulator